MSNLALAIFSRLSTDAGVSAIVGAGDDARIYPQYDRQSDRVFPLIVYQIRITPEPAYDGPSGIKYGTVTLAAIDVTNLAAETLALAIVASMDQPGGATQPGFTAAGVTVQGSFLQDDGIVDDVVTQPETEQILYYVKRMTFDVPFND